MAIISPTNYCCPMRSHFFLGIVGQRKGPQPIELADFIIQWEPQIVIGIRYCPFCGTTIERDAPRKVVGPDLIIPPEEWDNDKG